MAETGDPNISIPLSGRLRVRAAERLPGFPREEILRCFRLFPFRVYRKTAPFKALMFYFYYSPYASVLVKVLHPFKRILRKLAMGV